MDETGGNIIVGVFGSAFNPPHLGHMDAIRQALEKVGQVLVVPSAKHAFGKQMYPFAERVQMLKIIINESFDGHDKDRIRISLIEEEMLSVGSSPIYTYDVLTALDNVKSSAINCKFKFVLGPDNATPESWHKFFRHDDILLKWGLIVVEEAVNIRSSMIRPLVSQLKSCKADSKDSLELYVGKHLADYLVNEKGV